MPIIEPLQSLHDALQPLESLHEQAELGSWIHDSFSALEKLHEELTQWQSELARKETELDLRQDALEKVKTADKDGHKHVTQLEQQLADAKSQLQQVEQQSEQQRETANQRIAELEAALAAERNRAALASDAWKEEFHNLRGELERYYQLLVGQVQKVAATVQQVGPEPYAPLSVGAALAKSGELRRRAQSRRGNTSRKDFSAE